MNNYNPDPDISKAYSIGIFIFLLILSLIFVVAKIAGVIAWGWLWVFCPVWGPIALGLILMLLGIQPPSN